MPAKNYIVELTTEERSQLEALAVQNRVSAYKRRHAEMLLAVGVTKGTKGTKGTGWNAINFVCNYLPGI